MQRQKDRIVPIAFCSPTLTPAECHYSQIEKECLASVRTCEKYQRYLIGLPDFELQTDHKPLVPLMMSKDLDQGPIRCQQLLMRLMRFNPHVRHVPGKTLTQQTPSLEAHYHIQQKMRREWKKLRCI